MKWDTPPTLTDVPSVVHRDPRDVLADQADLLNSILAELRHIRAALGSGGSVSSIVIEDAAKGDPRVTTKSYVGSPLGREDVDSVLDTHGYAHRRAAEMAMQGWAETVQQLTDHQNERGTGA